MTRTAALVAAGMLLGALTGCASTAEAAPPTSAPPSPTSSAEPAPEPTIVAKPALAFDGSCEAIVDDATVSDLVGDQVAPIAEKSERAWAVEVLGGLNCGWSGDSEAYVWLDVFPSAGLEAQVSAADEASPYCYGGEIPDSRCSFSTVVGGYWLSGIVGVANGSSSSAIDAIDALTTSVANAAAQGDPVPAQRPDGMWSAPAECSEFAAGVDTTGILGAPFVAAKGSIGGEVTAGWLAALEAVGDFPCVWETSDHERWFGSELLPGAGWAIAELAGREGAAPVTVDGALGAVAVPLGGDTTAVYATDGVNLAWVSVPADIDQASAAALTAAVMAAASR
ncbi:MAG: hypothetical protein ABWY55_08380 [Microbacterium sp.]